MFETSVLTTKDRAAWKECLEKVDLKDPHYLAEYLSIYEGLPEGDCRDSFGGQGFLYCYGDENNIIAYPFMKRPIADDAFAGVSGLYDIASPYGYGGPLAHIEDKSVTDKLWTGFFTGFHSYCKESGIVSEFSRLHPIFENHIPVQFFSDGHTQKLSRVVYIDLSRSDEEINAGVNQYRRRHLRRMMANQSLTYTVAEQGQGAAAFYDLYTATMRKVGANGKYFFPLSFFEAAFRDLTGSFKLTHIYYEDKVIASLLLLKFGQLTYVWLAASRADYLCLRPNDLLYYRSVLGSRSDGVRYFIFGGGVSGEDSLFRYKATFSNTFIDFYIYKKIHLNKEYRELVELRQRYSGRTGEDYFPEYRLP